MPRNILFIHESLCGGGAEVALAALLGYLDPTRYRLTVLSIFDKGTPRPAPPPGIRILTMLPQGLTPRIRLLWHFRKSRDMLLRKRAAKVLGNEKFDVTVSFMEGDAMLVHSMVMDRAPRNITWVHADFMHHHWSRRYFADDFAEAAAYRAMDITVFVSAGILKSHIEALGPTSPAKVIPNIIDSGRIRRMADEHAELPPKRGLTLCCVGRLHESKRIDRFIDAIAILRFRHGIEVSGWIVGGGAMQATLCRQARDLGISEKVVFTGYTPNPYPVMKAADAIVLTSDAEGLPTVIAEAMVLGKPVVTTDVAGVRELADDDTAIITASATPQAIAGAILRLVTEPELADRMKTMALRRARSFEPSSVTEQVRALLD